MNSPISKSKNQVNIQFPQKDSIPSDEHPYRVIFAIDCHAKTPVEAALYVERCIQDLTYRPVFQVLTDGKELIEIDLENIHKLTRD